MLFAAHAWFMLVGRFLQEAHERRFPGASIKRVGSLLEFHPIEQALDVTGDRIRSHEQGCIERVNVFARYRTLRMSERQPSFRLVP